MEDGGSMVVGGSRNTGNNNVGNIVDLLLQDLVHSDEDDDDSDEDDIPLDDGEDDIPLDDGQFFFVFVCIRFTFFLMQPIADKLISW